ncbi:hypothetical protein ACMFMG_001357 [Clarireedia jacksonii]
MAPIHQPLSIRHLESKDTTATFQFTHPAACSFDFPSFSISTPCRPLKRSRALSDVDYNGSGSEGRKKRRLRLYLITSRLSRPFSEPASNIKLSVRRTRSNRKNVHRGNQSGRLRMDAARDFWRIYTKKESAEEVLDLREIAAERQRQRWNEIELRPSPLGLSNYDALDLEDDLFDADEGDGERVIYSDFSVMAPSTGEDDDQDYGYLNTLDALDGLSPENLQDQAPSTLPEDSIVEILKEEIVHDVCFVHADETGNGL